MKTKNETEGLENY